MAKEFYTYYEISLATGLEKRVIYYRKRRLGLQTKNGMFSYDDVKAIISYKPELFKPRSSRARLDRLKVQLKNDGFHISEDKKKDNAL